MIDEYQKIGNIAVSNVGSFKIVLTTVGKCVYGNDYEFLQKSTFQL